MRKLCSLFRHSFDIICHILYNFVKYYCLQKHIMCYIINYGMESYVSIIAIIFHSVKGELYLMVKSTITLEQAQNIQNAIQDLAKASQVLADVIEDTDYRLSNSTPQYIGDPEDFAYELLSWAQDENEEIERLINTKEEISVG